MENLTEKSFKEHVKKGHMVVDFWAEWCGPCKTLGPIFEELSKEIKTVHFAKVNVDEAGEIASEHGVRGIPTIIMFKNGEEVDRVVGLSSKEALKRKIESAFNL